MVTQDTDWGVPHMMSWPNGVSRSVLTNYEIDLDYNSPLDLEISVRLRRLVALLDEYPIQRAYSSEDFSAIAWIWQSLEDVEATILGLAQSNLPQLHDAQ